MVRPRIIIEEWDVFGKLTIIEELDQKKEVRYFDCKCDCWRITSVALTNLRQLKIKSCWCLQKEIVIKNNKRRKHLT